MKRRLHYDDVARYLANSLSKKEEICMIDVGGFLGVHSRSFMKSFPNSTIHIIEACPTNYKALCTKFKDSPQVHVTNAAACECDCETVIYVIQEAKYEERNGSSQSNSLYKNYVLSKQRNDIVPIKPMEFENVPIRGITLDSFCRENGITNIDYLKLNCEGCEYKILGSSELDFLGFTSILYLEMHSKSSEFRSDEFIEKRSNIQALLKDKGFQLRLGKRGVESSKHMCQVWSK